MLGQDIKQIGLIGGIGPAATEIYYRRLVSVFGSASLPLRLMIVHADVREMVGNLEAGRREVQASIFARHIDQLRAAGCDLVAVTSLGGHFCIRELEEVTSLPIISALPAIRAHLEQQNIRRIGVLGTRAVMQSGIYGLDGVEVVTVPAEELDTAHAHYTGMAIAGVATAEQRAYFEAAALRLVERGAEAVALGGTDLFLAFDRPSYPYPLIDCATIHADAIAAATWTERE